MTPFERLSRLATDVREIPGSGDHPAIQWGFMKCGLDAETPDETPWCSAILNLVFYLEGLPRSMRANARSWLSVGVDVELEHAVQGDVVIFQRGEGVQPGPEVLNAPGHVALLVRVVGDEVEVIGGNQGNKISIARFPRARVIGVRRVAA